MVKFFSWVYGVFMIIVTNENEKEKKTDISASEVTEKDWNLHFFPLFWWSRDREARNASKMAGHEPLTLARGR